MGVFNNFCASRNAPLNWLPRIFVYGHQERVRVALEGVIAKRPGDPLRGGGNRALAPPDQGSPPTAVTNYPNSCAAGGRASGIPFGEGSCIGGTQLVDDRVLLEARSWGPGKPRSHGRPMTSSLT